MNILSLSLKHFRKPSSRQNTRSNKSSNLHQQQQSSNNISFISYQEQLTALTNSIHQQQQRNKFVQTYFNHQNNINNSNTYSNSNNNKAIAIEQQQQLQLQFKEYSHNLNKSLQQNHNYQQLSFIINEQQQFLHRNSPPIDLLHQDKGLFIKDLLVEGVSDNENNHIIAIEQLYPIQQDHNQYQKPQSFTHEQRESLKNAFRYICRLIFKQAPKYLDRIAQIDVSSNNYQHMNINKSTINNKKNQKPSASSLSIDYLYLFQQAQLISGERYFKQHLEKLCLEQKRILLQFMIWFLKCKYLRYINKCNNQNKGKRKQMKKCLYIRFKNLIMLPYLEETLLILNQINVE